MKFWASADADSSEYIETPPSQAHQPTPLSNSEQLFDERIRTGSLVIIALAVVYGAMYWLQDILIPFVLSLALKYLLTPLIDVLSCAHMRSCRCRCPRGVAVLLSFVMVVICLLILGIVLGRSLTSFTNKSEQYRERVEQLLEIVFSYLQVCPHNARARMRTRACQGAHCAALSCGAAARRDRASRPCGA